jgi:hypothetical protein
MNQLGLAVLAVALASACLGPRVSDQQGASVHLLPAGAAVPSVASSADLAGQVAAHQGLDPGALAASGNVILRNTGLAAAGAVRYWAFGKATIAPSPLYELYRDGGGGALVRLDHPRIADAVPGDPGYSPIHTLQQVIVTAAYQGQVIASSQALQDAVDLGLVQAPVPTGTYVTSPIVLPELRLDVGGARGAIGPDTVYAHGRALGLFVLGGAYAVQPLFAFAPQSQLSVLREQSKPAADLSRPIFATPAPTAPPVGKNANYVPLASIVAVDLAPGVVAATVTSDAQLFTRSATGAIVAVAPIVSRFEVTDSVMWPLQVSEGEP